MENIIDNINLQTIIKISLILVLGIGSLKLLIYIVKKFLKKTVSIHTRKLIQKAIFWGGGLIILFTVLDQVGIKLTALLSALGIAGVAIGFASQTSFSNIISGIFLITERTFEIGDIVQIDSHLGRVVSIDLLSIKLKTFDNKLIRVPNEEMIKSPMINLTKYPIRRLDIEVGVAYKEDIGRVKNILFDIAKNDEYVLDEPGPIYRFKDFGNSSLDLVLGAWINSEDYFEAKNSFMEKIKERFDQEDIEIPFPHVTLYTGEETKEFPVKLNDIREIRKKE
ncbi:MAG: mechanosensitive ion channel family protein [Candidatus Mcinerneyibacterium aminivorans]|uniref:Mechanosensitive ion channel family protein n=1 Tax=Candidatus Mcinerneyibacterium aminivorans TaxID=2703815 RepID=A0A5D0MHK9_9BACT|nr:MAG: mechanosensitive ion channel family protein [Candidatus Mcinerneyibacterium aminivorans]